MARLHDLIGTECDLAEVSSALRDFASELGAVVIGAYHVHCSDEVECECADAFQRWFVANLLPTLKPGSRAPFRSVNLGARYEWGAIHIAEEHYATPATRNAFKLMATKINAHVAIRQTPAGAEYGRMDRYGSESTCCGALAATLGGKADLPAVRELRELFRSKGLDRLALLREEGVIPPEHRALLASVTNAALQAQRAVTDIRRQRPETPTIYLVLPCVTINRPDSDTELVVGEYAVDWTESEPQWKYRGLGDDPSKYRVEYKHDRLVLQDDQWPGE